MNPSKMATKALQAVLRVLEEAKIPESSLFEASRVSSKKNGIAFGLPGSDLCLSIQTHGATKGDGAFCNTCLLSRFGNKWSPVFIADLGYRETLNHTTEAMLSKHLKELLPKVQSRNCQSFNWSIFPALPEAARDKLHKDQVEDVLAKFESCANFNEQLV